MAGTLAIVVADIDALVTEYLSTLLERYGHHVRIAVATHAAVHAAVGAFDADACIIDLQLRDGQDPANIRRLTSDYPQTRVVVRTADTSSQIMQATLAAGAAGYLHKSRGPIQLIDLLTRVTEGNVVVEGTFARTAPAEEEMAADFRRLMDSLTPRERECLDLIVAAQGTAAMARQLGVSTMTVRSHVQSLLTKLGVHSRLEAASLTARSSGNLMAEVHPPPPRVITPVPPGADARTAPSIRPGRRTGPAA